MKSLVVKGFMDRVHATEVTDNTLAIFWLGQAGFMIKTPKGCLIAIDPYLSDYCEQAAGFKRIMPPVMAIEELEADYLFVSHEHSDHFDMELVKVLKDNKKLKILGPQECMELSDEAGISTECFNVLEENKTVNFGEFKVIPVKADHGELSPGALGFIFDFGFTRVYFAGDTAYSPDKLKSAYEYKPEIALLPINGEYGNLDSEQAAKLAGDIGVKVIIPCHYWTFIEHGSYPIQLIEAAKREAPDAELVFLAQGEGYIYDTLENE
jgi:Predicted Zn-dependent hydrolases of the beta-lactamase fold